jgi:succinyl-diaminopimelate desuccinylase
MTADALDGSAADRATLLARSRSTEPPNWSDKTIEVDVEGVVRFAAQLVRTRSVNEPGVSSEQTVADLVVAKMREWDWEPEVVEVAPDRPNVIVTIDGGGGPGPMLAFEGHLDVVTEGNRDEWTFDPYGVEIVNGRMYGRGSADMKAGVAAMLFGARALELAGTFPGSLRLFLLSDEEGMMLGAKFAVASGALVGVTGVVVCEPEGDEVCPSSKGAMRLRVDLTGKMTHAAMPHEGRNPLPVLGKILVALESLQAEVEHRYGVHPYLGSANITPTVVEAGTPVQMNTSPARASLWIDVRTVPGADHNGLIDRIRMQCSSLGADANIAVAIEVIDDRPPVDTPIDDPVVTCLVDAHQRICGVRPNFGGVPGTTDGTIFTRDGHVPTVVYGPGDKWIAHQADEFVMIESISRYARVYAEAPRAFLARTTW